MAAPDGALSGAMRSKRLPILVVILIFSAFGLGWALPREPAHNGHVPRNQSNRIATAEKERDMALRKLGEERDRSARLKAEVKALCEPKATEPPVVVVAPEPKKPEGPPTEAELKAGLQNFGENLRNIILGNEKGKQAAESVRELLERAGPEAIRKLADRFGDDTEAMGARVVIAHALAQSNDPAAIEALAVHLRDPDAGMIVHRFAAHALAFSEADGVDTILREVAHNAEDRGTRANASFGLARKGDDDGLTLYLAATDEAFEAGDPAALQYLGGLQLLGEKALPGVRKRLMTYTNEQALLVLIGVVKATGDQGAMPQLEKLAADNTRPASVRKAADAALRVLGKTN